MLCSSLPKFSLSLYYLFYLRSQLLFEDLGLKCVNAFDVIDL